MKINDCAECGKCPTCFEAWPPFAWKIGCFREGCSAKPIGYGGQSGKTREQAITEWNSRKCEKNKGE